MKSEEMNQTVLTVTGRHGKLVKTSPRAFGNSASGPCVLRRERTTDLVNLSASACPQWLRLAFPEPLCVYPRNGQNSTRGVDERQELEAWEGEGAPCGITEALPAGR